MTPDQAAIAERLRAVLAEDERVLSAWLSGSFGRGEGDAFSDIDVTAVVEEEDLAACVAEYGGRRNPVGPSAHQSIQFGRVACNTTPDWMRYDILFVTPAEFRRQDPERLKPLVRATRPPAGSTPEIVMGGEKIVETAREFLRILGLLTVAVGRQEWLMSIEGLGLMRRMTIDLMVEANGRSHLRGGVKRLNPFLTPQQRAALEAATSVPATREGAIEGSLALARLFLPLARRLVAERGGAWPDAWEAATRDHLRRALGDDLAWPG